LQEIRRRLLGIPGGRADLGPAGISQAKVRFAMIRSPIPQLQIWLPALREKLRLGSKHRFLILLLFFNALLITILLLSVRNQEVRARILVIETQIRQRIERLATVQASQVQIVYVTQTPTVQQIAVVTPTSTATQVPGPTRTATPTSSPPATLAPTPTPTSPPSSPTTTASPTPTATPRPTEPTVTATHTPTWTPTATRTVTPPPSPSRPDRLILSALPAEIVADGSSTSQIRAQVLDQRGQAVSEGTRVLFTTDRGTLDGASTVARLTTGGIAEVTLTSSTSAGPATVRATADAVSGQVVVRFRPGPPAALTLDTTSSRVTTGESVEVRAAVSDRFGNPVRDGTPVDFGTTLGTLNEPQANTVGGIARVVLSSQAAGQATVTAVTGSASGAVQVYFMPSIEIIKSVARSTAPAGSPLTYRITIRNISAGGQDALLRTLQDAMPPGFEYVSGSTNSPAFGSPPQVNGDTLTWTASPLPYPLPAGSSIATTFQLAARAMPGTYANQAAVEGDNFRPASTGPTAEITLLGPALLDVTPRSGCNGAPVSVGITGSNLAPGAQASLGAWALTVAWIDENTLQATVPPEIAAGTYDMTVLNPGGSSATLLDGYTAQNCGSLETTLEYGFLGTYGVEPLTAGPNGDDDQVQVIYLEVPATHTGPVYIGIFDPDCGGDLDRQNGLSWDTPFTFAVYGGTGAYTDPDARSAHPSTGIASGVELATATFAVDDATNAGWYYFGPFDVTLGEPVEVHGEQKHIFKLAVVAGPQPPFPPGVRFADLNLYNVALSTSPSGIVTPPGSRIFAFSWTFLIPEANYLAPPRMFPYVHGEVTALQQHNWDYDNDAFATGGAGITITTPVRTLAVPDAAVSGNDEERWSEHPTLDGERGTTWTIRCWAEPTGAAVDQLQDNLVTFWATDRHGEALALFGRSTIDPPPGQP
jgi:uncharacterized repeat protein (TIGR01451 family)